MLRGTSDLRGYFRTNRTPIYFISPTAFNLLGIDRWVRSFEYVNYFDSFDGAHPQVFVPQAGRTASSSRSRTSTTTSSSHKEVLDHIVRPGGLALFVFLDEETEALCKEAGLQVALPSAELRHRLDSKIVTTQLGNEAGVPSVPNRLGRASRPTNCWRSPTGLGDDLVVQTPYGDSGKTTFFIRGERDLTARGRARRRGAEGHEAHQLPRRGGRGGHHPPRHRRRPGHARPHRPPELTPYRGGWCGNDIFRRAVARAPRARPGTDRAARRPARARGLPRVLRGRLPRSTSTPASSTSASWTRRLSGVTSMTSPSAPAPPPTCRSCCCI